MKRNPNTTHYRWCDDTEDTGPPASETQTPEDALVFEISGSCRFHIRSANFCWLAQMFMNMSGGELPGQLGRLTDSGQRNGNGDSGSRWLEFESWLNH